MPNAPRTPNKEPTKGIPRNSPYYSENNENNLNAENLIVEKVNLNKLVENVKKFPGNSPIPERHPNLNYRPKVPTMKLPAHLKGGKKTRRRQSRRRLTRRR